MVAGLRPLMHIEFISVDSVRKRSGFTLLPSLSSVSAPLTAGSVSRSRVFGGGLCNCVSGVPSVLHSSVSAFVPVSCSLECRSFLV